MNFTLLNLYYHLIIQQTLSMLVSFVFTRNTLIIVAWRHLLQLNVMYYHLKYTRSYVNLLSY